VGCATVKKVILIFVSVYFSISIFPPNHEGVDSYPSSLQGKNVDKVVYMVNNGDIFE
jgi:hypothetical protein